MCCSPFSFPIPCPESIDFDKFMSRFQSKRAHVVRRFLSIAGNPEIISISHSGTGFFFKPENSFVDEANPNAMRHYFKFELILLAGYTPRTGMRMEKYYYFN